MSLNLLTAYNTVEASATVNQLALKVKSYVNQLTQKTDEPHKTGLAGLHLVLEITSARRRLAETDGLVSPSQALLPAVPRQISIISSKISLSPYEHELIRPQKNPARGRAKAKKKCPHAGPAVLE